MNILIQGKSHSIISQYQIENKLSANFYKLIWDAFNNLSLEKVNSPELPSNFIDLKELEKEIIMTTFDNSNTNLGVCLSGVKGTGKSVDANILCVKSKLPVIIIDRPVPKSINLSLFFSSIEQEITVFFDEFGKNFEEFADKESNNQSQQDLLSILDGINSDYKRFFVFTTNEGVNEYLLNRPSRVKFLVHYDYLSFEQIKLILNLNPIKPEFKENLLSELDSANLTIDIILSIINMIKKLDRPYSDFKDIFNYKVDYLYVLVSENKKENLRVIINGEIKAGNSVHIKGHGYYEILKDCKIKFDKNIYKIEKHFNPVSKVL